MHKNEVFNGYKQIILKHLRKELPELFKIHYKLIDIANPETNEINMSLNELAEMLSYSDYQLYSHLLNLVDLDFIDCPDYFDTNEKIKIKIHVNH